MATPEQASLLMAQDSDSDDDDTSNSSDSTQENEFGEALHHRALVPVPSSPVPVDADTMHGGDADADGGVAGDADDRDSDNGGSTSSAAAAADFDTAVPMDHDGHDDHDDDPVRSAASQPRMSVAQSRAAPVSHTRIPDKSPPPPPPPSGPPGPSSASRHNHATGVSDGNDTDSTLGDEYDEKPAHGAINGVGSTVRMEAPASGEAMGGSSNHSNTSNGNGNTTQRKMKITIRRAEAGHKSKSGGANTTNTTNTANSTPTKNSNMSGTKNKTRKVAKLPMSPARKRLKMSLPLRRKMGLPSKKNGTKGPTLSSMAAQVAPTLKVKSAADNKQEDAVVSSSALRRKLHLPLKKKTAKDSPAPATTTTKTPPRKPTQSKPTPDKHKLNGSTEGANGQHEAGATHGSKKGKSALLPSGARQVSTPYTTSMPKFAGSAKAPKSSPSSTRRKLPASSQFKTVTLPAISSPGLLVPTSAGMFRGAVDSNGLSKPSALFDHAMKTAGYTRESRTNAPHRGSSTQRQVGDLFDTDVKTVLQPSALIPTELLLATVDPHAKTANNSENNSTDQVGSSDSSNSKDEPKENGAGKPKDSGKDPTQQISLLRHLINRLDSTATGAMSDDGEGQNSNKNGNQHTCTIQGRPFMRFVDMIPVSLNISYPEQYIKKRSEYINQVEAREKAIVDYQEEEERLEIEHELNEAPPKTDGEPNIPPKPSIKIPPIPKPPDPPLLQECEGLKLDDFEDQKPLYLVKGKEKYVSHLDKSCFHLTQGRYFGLHSNSIIDPQFYGANAPGVAGLGSGSGLATSTAGGSTISSHIFTAASSASIAKPDKTASSASTSRTPSSSSTSSKQKSGNSTTSKSSTAKKSSSSTTSSNKKPEKAKPKTSVKGAKFKGEAPTATSSQLRKIIDLGGKDALHLKQRIMRAAVHASRTGNHGFTFKGLNGEYYPDVSKAFAAHAGIKPCTKCKNNKQGAYHCRLRRKHKEIDFDGSDSPGVLAPFFAAPLERLLADEIM